MSNLSRLDEQNLNIADSYKSLNISANHRDFAFVLLNSSLFFFYWIVFSDCYNLTKKYFQIKIPTKIDIDDFKDLAKVLNDDLFRKMIVAEYTYKNKGTVRFAQFFPKQSKSIIDKIDKVLAKHYGFTEEELDFIINYDIKYRMGDELNE